MALPQPQPPMSLDLDTKPGVPLAPNSLISSSSSSAIDPVSAAQLSDDDVYLSDSDTVSSSIRSTSDTYLEDFGGECVRDTDWPPDRVSRVDAYRVYDSTDDEGEARRRAARVVLDSADVGVYEEWAQRADDELSLEDLQREADAVTKAMEGVSMDGSPRESESYEERKRRRRPNTPGDNRPLVTSIESLDDNVVSAIPLVEIVNGYKKPAKPARPRKGEQVHTLPDDELEDLSLPWNDITPIETLPDDDELDLPPILPLPKMGKIEHTRIEDLPDDDELDVTKPEHTRIETLPDFPTPPPLGRIGMLPDGTLNMPTPPTFPTPPSLSTPPPVGRIETLPNGDGDVDILSEPTTRGDRRIQMLENEDSMNCGTSLDRRRGSDKDDDMIVVREETAQRIETLSDGEVTGCAKLGDLSERVAKVTRGLADIQMITAGKAASAEAWLGKTNSSSQRAEICRLRITLDHLARLTLERAHKARDEADRHG